MKIIVPHKPKLLTPSRRGFIAGAAALIAAPAVLLKPADAYWQSRAQVNVSAGGAPANANAVHFDGTNDYLASGAKLTGISDTAVGTSSIWFKLTGGDGVRQCLFQTNVAGPARAFAIERMATNKIQVIGRNVAGTDVVLLTSTTSYTADATWHHCLSQFNTGSSYGLLYIDGANDLAGGSTFVNDIVAYDTNVVDCTIGALGDASSKFQGDLAALWFDTVNPAFFDLTNVANRELFRSSGGSAVALGATGSAPTGVQPFWFHNHATVASWKNNLGSDATVFTENGALTAAASNPP